MTGLLDDIIATKVGLVVYQAAFDNEDETESVCFEANFVCWM
jgi:hypothetical protein